MELSIFEMLQAFKEISEETKQLVLKMIRKKHGDLSQPEIIKAFESGIAGEYGKVYSLDPQTLLGWIERYKISRYKKSNYYDAPLYPVDRKEDAGMSMQDWRKEANKCYRAFLNGVSHTYFHRHVYDRMIVDDMIKLNSYKRYYEGYETDKIHDAQRMVLRDIFIGYKEQCRTEIYFIEK